jgi:hypothetical protein
MTENCVSGQQRRVMAWFTISMDGYTNGSGGPAKDTLAA